MDNKRNRKKRIRIREIKRQALTLDDLDSLIHEIDDQQSQTNESKEHIPQVHFGSNENALKHTTELMGKKQQFHTNSYHYLTQVGGETLEKTKC